MAGPLPGAATAAISLTFDGALVEHVEMVAPILDEAGIRGTFFVTVPAMLERPAAWRTVAQSGHEVGSHPHFGVSVDGQLDWTKEAVRIDLLETNRGIASITGFLPTSFAKSGSSTRCMDGEYDADLRIYAAVRSSEVGSNDLLVASPTDVKCLPWDRISGALKFLPVPGGWTVPVFTRFFDPHWDQAENDLRALVEVLVQREDIWVAPFGEVAAALPRPHDSR